MPRVSQTSKTKTKKQKTKPAPRAKPRRKPNEPIKRTRPRAAPKRQEKRMSTPAKPAANTVPPIGGKATTFPPDSTTEGPGLHYGPGIPKDYKPEQYPKPKDVPAAKLEPPANPNLTPEQDEDTDAKVPLGQGSEQGYTENPPDVKAARKNALAVALKLAVEYARHAVQQASLLLEAADKAAKAGGVTVPATSKP